MEKQNKTFKQLIYLINPVEETNECNFAHNLNGPEDGVTRDEARGKAVSQIIVLFSYNTSCYKKKTKMIDKETNKVEAGEDAVSSTILLFLYNTNYYKREDDIM